MGGITPTGKNLARTTRAVAVLIKILWQGDRVGQVLPAKGGPGYRRPRWSSGADR